MSVQPMSKIVHSDNTALRDDITALLEEGLNAVERTMFEVVNSDVTVLRDASRHILGSGGKRIRPRMIILSYIACGGRDFSDVARAAAAVELVHTASVVHDDINDHGVLRRGKPSVNALWGRTFALLTGDFLFAKVYELMAPLDGLNVELAEATVALVEGETLQASAVKENTLTREIYNRIIALKTAALFKSGARMGARLAGASPDVVEAMGQYGYNIGIAFQVVDDILDLTADSEQLGKTAGIDLEQGRGIGAVIATEEHVEPAPSDPMDSVKRKLLDGGAIKKGVEYANMLVKMAVDALDEIPASPSKDALIHLAHTVVERTY